MLRHIHRHIPICNGTLDAHQDVSFHSWWIFAPFGVYDCECVSTRTVYAVRICIWIIFITLAEFRECVWGTWMHEREKMMMMMMITIVFHCSNAHHTDTVHSDQNLSIFAARLARTPLTCHLSRLRTTCQLVHIHNFCARRFVYCKRAWARARSRRSFVS